MKMSSVIKVPVVCALWVIIAMFAWIVYSIFEEYEKLDERMLSLHTTISTAIDTAVQNTMMSEEFFTGDTENLLSSTNNHRNYISYYKNGYLIGSGKNIDVYSLLYTMTDGYSTPLDEFDFKYSDLPDSNFESFQGNDFMAETYAAIYGGEFISDTGLMNSGFISDSNRVPTKEFSDFYDSIGKSINKSTYLVHYEDGYFKEIQRYRVPVLTQMGLDLGDTGIFPLGNINEADNLYRNNDTVAVTHRGKSLDMNDPKYYYLTPYSLGVTYLQPDVMKLLATINLSNTIRLNKVSGGVKGVNTNFGVAEGCIPLTISDNHNAVFHEDTPTRAILNDGYIEYDMDSLETKIEYFAVNLYEKDSSGNYVNADLLREIYGAVPDEIDVFPHNDQKKVIGDYFTNAADGKDYIYVNADEKDLINGNKTDIQNDAGTKIIAKITVNLDVCIPYTSPVMQMYINSHMRDTNGHFGLSADIDGDGTVEEGWLKYTYVTYACLAN
ncbi:MAG: hypothetical protein LBM93_01690 [Oscillospiraceae bacterium]|jgi:hypothetical protein|nr:hypothetical protein [Oscillospiraceae bacterium]